MGREAMPDPFDGFVQGEEQLRRTAPTQPQALGTAEPYLERERSISYSLPYLGEQPASEIYPSLKPDDTWYPRKTKMCSNIHPLFVYLYRVPTFDCPDVYCRQVPPPPRKQKVKRREASIGIWKLPWPSMSSRVIMSHPQRETPQK